jgi:orotate phosphoribosyltransferase
MTAPDAARPSDRDRLIALLATRSARQGDFVLASGRRSSLYVDCRVTTMSPDGQLLIGREGLRMLRGTGWDIDAIGGLTLGADPVSYAIAHASAQASESGDTRPMLRAFTVRKEAKGHGTGRLIEGPFASGDHVVVVEDVITTGGSALKAAESVRSAGGQVLGVLALVDREEGGREALAAAGLETLALVGASELVRLMAIQGS